MFCLRSEDTTLDTSASRKTSSPPARLIGRTPPARSLRDFCAPAGKTHQRGSARGSARGSTGGPQGIGQGAAGDVSVKCSLRTRLKVKNTKGVFKVCSERSLAAQVKPGCLHFEGGWCDASPACASKLICRRARYDRDA
eukprot:8079081-Pyramimonas_sp.AAC.1